MAAPTLPGYAPRRQPRFGRRRPATRRCPRGSLSAKEASCNLGLAFISVPALQGLYRRAVCAQGAFLQTVPRSLKCAGLPCLTVSTHVIVRFSLVFFKKLTRSRRRYLTVPVSLTHSSKKLKVYVKRCLQLPITPLYQLPEPQGAGQHLAASQSSAIINHPAVSNPMSLVSRLWNLSVEDLPEEISGRAAACTCRWETHCRTPWGCSKLNFFSARPTEC